MTSAAELPSYTLLHLPTDQETPSEQQLKADLEKGDPRVKAEALKKVIFMITNGEKIPGILMTIIRLMCVFNHKIEYTYPIGIDSISGKNMANGLP